MKKILLLATAVVLLASIGFAHTTGNSNDSQNASCPHASGMMGNSGMMGTGMMNGAMTNMMQGAGAFGFGSAMGNSIFAFSWLGLLVPVLLVIALLLAIVLLFKKIQQAT